MLWERITTSHRICWGVRASGTYRVFLVPKKLPPMDSLGVCNRLGLYKYDWVKPLR